MTGKRFVRRKNKRPPAYGEGFSRSAAVRAGCPLERSEVGQMREDEMNSTAVPSNQIGAGEASMGLPALGASLARDLTSLSWSDIQAGPSGLASRNKLGPALVQGCLAAPAPTTKAIRITHNGFADTEANSAGI